MNRPREPKGSFDLQELWHDLQKLEEDALDDERGAALAALLGRSPAARRAYLEYFQQAAVLRMEAAILRERGLLPFVESPRQTRLVFQRSVMAAAALVALIAVIAGLIAVSLPAPSGFSATASANTRWEIEGASGENVRRGSEIREGSTLRVYSGTLSLETEEGDILILQGPTTVSFPKLRQPQLEEGWLWIDTAGSGKAFDIRAQGLRVRDIGTRFGVRAPTGGATEVHLVDGRVDVISARTGERLVLLAEKGKAYTLDPTGKVEERAMAPDPFPTLRRLLSSSAAYRTTALGQTPTGYWTLDTHSNGYYPNLIPGSLPAIVGQLVRGGDPGPRAAEDLHGFPAGNRALYLNGDEKRSLIAGLDGMHGVNPTEGAVSFWIRPETGEIARDQTLWLAGHGSEDSSIPLEAILQTRLEKSGRVILEVRDGDTNVSVTSEVVVNDGRWHHVAASWAPTSVDLFIDGVHAGSGLRQDRSADVKMRGRYVRFGKPSMDQIQSSEPFVGWVDEIALWDRPLSEVEVSAQFGAALDGIGE